MLDCINTSKKAAPGPSKERQNGSLEMLGSFSKAWESLSKRGPACHTRVL